MLKKSKRMVKKSKRFQVCRWIVGDFHSGPLVLGHTDTLEQAWNIAKLHANALNLENKYFTLSDYR